MAKLRLNLTMSLDGYVADPGQSLEHPLGEGGLALHDWAFSTRSFRATHDMDGGPAGYACVDLASSPAVAHFSYVRLGGA